MGNASSAEIGIDNQPLPATPELKPTPDQIADRVIENRERFQEHLISLRSAEAEEDASEIADKIEAAGEKADFDKEQEKIKSIKPSEAPTPKLQEKLTPTQTTPDTTSNTNSNLRDKISNVAWKARKAYTVLSQLGGIHPIRQNGEWKWVMEPWARIKDDPRQNGFSDESDYYADKFAKVKGRNINMTELGGENPSVVPDGASGGIKLLDHRRIHEARRARKAIEINLERPDGKPMTHN